MTVTVPTTFSQRPIGSGGVIGPACAYSFGAAEPASRSTRCADKRRAVRRDQRRVVLAREIFGNDELVAVAAGQNQVGTGAMEMRGEQELRVGNDDVVGIRRIGMEHGSRTAAVAAHSKIRSRHYRPSESVL